MKKLKIIYYSLPIFFLNILNFLFSKLHNPIIFDFLNSPIGSNYGLNKNDRQIILKKIMKIINNIQSATSLETQITLAKHLLSLPKYKKGYVVECGSFKGASTATMSIICKIIGRNLIVYDSFEGLPKSASNTVASYMHFGSKEIYKKGMYKGSLSEVKNNIVKFGSINSCIFRKGNFDITLKKHSEKIEFLFLDVDLPKSTKICIKFLWKKIIKNSYIFTDDSCDMENVKIWFDDNWWKKTLKLSAPGYIGSGCGLPLNHFYSGLGYTIKSINFKKFKKVKWIK